MHDVRNRLTIPVAAILVASLVATGSSQDPPVDTNRLALARELLRYKYREAMEQTTEDRAGLAGAPTNITAMLDEETRAYFDKVARAAARELTATELAQMLHLERSETIVHLRNRWKAVRPRLEDLSTEFLDAAATRFAETVTARVGARTDRDHFDCKLCDSDSRGPLDTWATHWLGTRPVSADTGRQPELHPLYRALTSTNAPDATVEAYLRRLQQDAEEGDEDSALALGCLRWLAEDFAMATNWLTRAAHKDSHGAQFLLGHALTGGWGVSQDQESGLCFLRAAAAQGLAQAQYKLGMIYLEPDGAFSDRQKGLQWMKLAADNGIPEAGRILGNCLLADHPTAARRKTAERYLHRAAIAGVTEAYDDLVAFHMTWGNSDVAVRWLKKQINRGKLGAYHTLAVKYQNTGKTAEAFRWWSRGAERGHRKSQLETARMYAAGRGCEQDLVAAERWLIIAAADEQERKRAYEGIDPPSEEDVEKAREEADAFGEETDGVEER